MWDHNLENSEMVNPTTLMIVSYINSVCVFLYLFSFCLSFCLSFSGLF